VLSEESRTSVARGTILQLQSDTHNRGANPLRRDYDQVLADIDSPHHLSQYKATKDAEDLPGLGQHYCTECSKWFESEYNLKAHTKGKNHKRR
jgi:hypothetical protein